MWRSGRQMRSEKIAFAYCSACCYFCDCFVVGWPISGVLFEASMIFNDLARNASSTLSLWGCTRCQRPAKGKIAALAQHKFYTRQNYNLEFAPIRRNERSYRLLHLEIEFETDSYIHETKRALLQADIRLTKLQPEYHLWLDPLQAAADQSTPKHSKASNHPIQAF